MATPKAAKPSESGAPEVEAFFAKLPEEARPHMTALRKLLRSVVPDAAEAIKWGQPAFVLKKILFVYGAFRGHSNFTPTTVALDAFRGEIEAAGVQQTRGMLQLPYAAPLPIDLIRRIAEFRRDDLLANGTPFTV